MFVDLLIYAVLGSALGAATGLVPGLHVNNMLPFMLSLLPLIGDPYSLAVMIISMSVVQTFVSFIPSIFLGAPDSDHALSTLPGHRLLHEGRGFEAIKLTVIGGLGSLLASVGMLVAFSGYFPALYDLSRPYIQYVLAGVVCFMLLSERKPSRVAWAALVFLASGALGFLVLQSPVGSQQNILFPMLAGLFGISTLATSIMDKSSIPAQSKDGRLSSTWSAIVKSIALGSVAGLLVGFLPAIGVSQAAAIFQHVGGLGDARNFLTSLAGINVANEVFSLNSVYLIGNPRSGSSVAIDRIFGSIGVGDVEIFMGAIVFSAGVGAAASMLLGRRIPHLLARLNYTWLSLGIISLMCAMVLLTCGPYGLLVAGASTSIGVLCARVGVRRSSCMGVLILPSILFFTGAAPALLTLLGV